MSYKLKNIEKSLAKLEQLKERLKKKSVFIGYVRLAVFLGGLVLGAFSFFSIDNLTTQIILFLSFIIFILVSVWQGNYIKYHKTISNWIDIKKSFLARAKLDWDNINRNKVVNETKFSDLEIDFNLIGEKSLLHLIDFSSSNEGAFLLRDFVSNHNLDGNIIDERQNIVKELISFNRFRERFLLILSSIKRKTDGDSNINKWLDSKSDIKKLKVFLILLIPLGIANIGLIVLHFFGILSSMWMISSFIYFAIYYLSNKYYNKISQVSDLLKDELGRTSKLFEFIEKNDFSNYPKLNNLCKTILNKETSPTKLLNKVLRVVNILPLRKNPFVWFFLALLFPIDFLIAYKLEKYKIELNKNYVEWKNVLHHLEAYISMATFAKLNCEYKYPNIVDDNIVFEVKKIGHPLIQKSEKINNNFSFEKVGDVVIITGSNMSGKSTFLRALGINICLAYAGAPVNASSFSLPLMRIFSCIKVSDSVIDGISYFYSEVKRLKQLLVEFDKDEKIPIIFFIDEIFKGTNNIERRIGSSAYIKSLVGLNGIGFVTTHDLDLIKLAEDNPKISNYHFKENIKDNKMEFDYTIHEGPCPTTNALQIMKIEGLPI